MGISIWEQSRGDVRLPSSMRGPRGAPGQPILPRIHEQRQARGFPSPREAGMLQGKLRWGKAQSPATATEG